MAITDVRPQELQILLRQVLAEARVRRLRSDDAAPTERPLRAHVRGEEPQDRVAVVLDAGTVGGTAAAGEQNGSTILDCSSPGAFRIVRQGVLPRAVIAEALGDLLVDG